MFVGLQKTSLVNFPHRMATVVFLPGCNMRCPYCHNAELALGSVTNFIPYKTGQSYYTIEEFYSFLKQRHKIINALVISGGEPCISPRLNEIIGFAKSLRFEIKLDTNGCFPDKLLELLDSFELTPNMIALDIKTSISRYDELFPKINKGEYTKVKNSFLKTLTILKELKEKKSTIEIEYRTVLVPNLITKTEILDIASLLPKTAIWRLAQFVPGVCLNPKWNTVKPYTISQADQLTKIAKTIIPNTELR